MREIKFRAWDFQNKCLVYSEIIGIVAFFRAITIGDLLDPEMYTGLHDKNGREIYEGDLLEEEKGYLFEVVYDPEWARFKLQWRTKAIQFPEWNRGKLMSIIGNIHESQGLIND